MRLKAFLDVQLNLHGKQYFNKIKPREYKVNYLENT